MATAKPGTVNTVSTPAQNALYGAMQTSTPSVLPTPKQPTSNFNFATTPAPQTFSSLTSKPLNMGSTVPSTSLASGTTPLGTKITTPGLATNINKNIGATVSPAAPQYNAAQTTPNYSQGNGQGSIVPGANYNPTPTLGNTGPLPSAPVTPQSPAPAAGIIASTPTPSAINPDFTGLIGGATQVAQGNEAIGQKATDIAEQYGKQIADVGGKGANYEAGQITTGTSPVASGNAAITAQTTAAQQQALATGEEAALQGNAQQLVAQQQEQNGLNTTAELVQPSTASYGQTVFDPLTQSFKSNGSGNLDPQTLANQLAPLVASGQMTIDAANAQMTGGVAGTTALRQAILAANPNFNFNLSSASGATQQQGQQISAAIPPANQALDALQTSFNNLSGLQQGNIPIIGNVPLLSQLIQGASMNFGPGRDAASAYQGALNEARSRIDGALAGVIGVDAASKQATALLPDNMLPSEIPQKIAAAKQYLQNQLNSYTGSGQQNNSGGSSNGSVSAGGFDFVQDANGNWIAK